MSYESDFYLDPDSERHISDTVEKSLWYEEHMTTKAEIVEYYREEYGRDWRSKFTDAWAGAFGDSRNTASRRVQGERADRPVRKSEEKKKWEELGKILPPKILPRKWKGRRVRITIQVTITFSDGKPVTKIFTRTLTVQQTNDMVEGNDLSGVMEAYGIDPDNIEEMTDVHISEIEWLD